MPGWDMALDPAPKELVDDAWTALGAADPTQAFVLSQQALGKLRGDDPLVFQALMVTALAQLALRSPLRAEASIGQARAMTATSWPRALSFLCIEIAYAIARDPEESAEPSGPSPADETSTDTLARLHRLASVELQRDWYEFLGFFADLMLRNGRPEWAAAAVRRARERIPIEALWKDEASRPAALGALRAWARAELELALAGQASRPACAGRELSDLLDRLPEEARDRHFDLRVLEIDLAFAARQRPEVVAALVGKAERAASTDGQRRLVLSRLGALAVRHPYHAARFREELARPPPDELDSALSWPAALIAKAAFAIRSIEHAERWLATVERSPLGNLELLDAQALRAELHLARGETTAALAQATRAFAELAALAELAPALRDAASRLTYVRVRGHLDRAAARASASAREQDVALALDALDEGRALSIALAMARDDARADQGPIGRQAEPLLRRRLAPTTLPDDAVALVFLWDNRKGRLGVFVVDGPRAPRFSWLRLASGAPGLVAAAWTAAHLGDLDGLPGTELQRALASLVAAAGEVVDAELNDDPATSIGAIVRARRPRRIGVVPHGPLVGLPLHVPLLRAAPELLPAVSFAPMRSPPGQARDPTPLEHSAVAYYDPKVKAVTDQFAKLSDGLAAVVDGHQWTDARDESLVREIRAEEILTRSARMLAILAHGRAVGDRRRSALDASPAFESAMDLAGTTVTTHDILRARKFHYDVALLCLCSGARHIAPLETEAGDRTVWQIAFLDDPTMGVAGAFLASGVPDVVAFPTPVHVDSAVGFFIKLCAVVPSHGWGRDIVEAQRSLHVLRWEQADLRELMAQHWSWLPVLTRGPEGSV